MLPDGWSFKNINEIGIQVIDGDRGKNYPKDNEFQSTGSCLFLSAKNVTKAGFDFSLGQFITNEKHKLLNKGEVKVGDIVITTRGSIGHFAYYNHKKYQSMRINSGMAILRSNVNYTYPDFLYEVCRSQIVKTQIEKASFGSAQPQLTIAIIKKFRIPLPPLPEQKKIAAILSTWDRAIEGTEKLLANSQQQKKALMQQLLTGKKRLPGFTGEWLCHKLGEIAGFLKGKGLSKADINPTGKTPCIHYGSLFTEQPSIITETKTLTNTFKGAVFSKKNDVLMPTSDVTPAGLAVASAIQKDNVLLGNDILIIRPNSERLYGPFLSRIIRNSKKKILSFATGTTVFHLYASDMKGFQLLVPPVPEQKAIAAVLSTADEEITALESDLSRLRQEKKALMQQLLTGKIRVAV